MKHVAAFIFFVIVFFLALPIMLIKWNSDGLETICNGIDKLCGIN